MTNVMTNAWEIARKGQSKFGGKVVEYLSESLRIAWAIAKGDVKVTKVETIELFNLPELKGTEKQVKWAEDIRYSASRAMENEVMKEEYIVKSRMPMGKDKVEKRDVTSVVKALFSEETIQAYLDKSFNKENTIETMKKAGERYNRFKEIMLNESAKFWIENRENTEHNQMFKAFKNYVANGIKNHKEVN